MVPRRMLLGANFISIIPTIKAAVPTKEEEPRCPPPMKPSDLPIYEAPHAEYVSYINSKKKPKQDGYIKSTLESPVKAFREQALSVWEKTDSVKNIIKDNYNEFQDRTAWIVKYLREEENKEQRYGAVAIGGLTGFIFGLRGGIIRRLFYGGIGTSIMGTICFPEESNEIAKSSLISARHYINVGYNFFYGVKPGDPQLEVKFPDLSLPKDFSEFVDMTMSMASSLKQAVMPPPTKDEISSNEATDSKNK